MLHIKFNHKSGLGTVKCHTVFHYDSGQPGDSSSALLIIISFAHNIMKEKVGTVETFWHD